MKIIEAITTLKNAIDLSVSKKSDAPWQIAAQNAGLASSGDNGTIGIDEDYVGTIGHFEIRIKHTCRDTSKPFSLGPDRTRIRLEILHNGKEIDNYTAGYED